MDREWIRLFGKQFESNGENAEYGGQPEILAPVHVIRETNHCSLCRLRQRHCIWRIFNDRPGIDILYYPEERDDKGELIKAGHYVLLRRATLLSQPENEKVYSLGDYVAVCSQPNDWFMCVISEINYPSKEVKVRFMRKSGQYFLLSKKLEKWFPKSAIFHRCSIPSIDNRKWKHILDRDFKMDLHIYKSQLKWM